MTALKILFKGGRVVDPSQDLDGVLDLLLEDGKVAALGPDLDAGDADVVDASGLVVTPGFIDGRVFLGEPGYEHRETLDSGLQAAAAGGFTAVVTTPDVSPTVDRRAVAEMLTRDAARLGWARLHPMAALSKGLKGEELAEMGELQEAGAVAAFDGVTPVGNPSLFRRALLYSTHFDMPILHRAADPQLDADGVMHEGEWSTRLGLPGCSSVSERSVLARDLLLAEETGGRYHLAPVSTAGAVDQIRRAKEAGIRATCDVTLHHLLLTDGDVHKSVFSTATRVDPPLRGESDVKALLAGLADGTVDMIVSDHRPYHADEKSDVQFSVAPPGIVGLETAVSLGLDRLVAAGHIELGRFVELMSCAPARLFGLETGTLAVGAPADVTLLDLDAEVTVEASTFRSLGRCTPFDGWTLKGAAVGTYVGGRRIELPELG